MKKLLIVESPAKAKTIGKYLGDEFSVKSSVGHIRDLPKTGGLAIEIEPVKGAAQAWTFKPTYAISADKRKVVTDLRAAAKAADEIYLAPDPDREGEAIAWHLSQVLAKETKGKRVARVSYNEITRPAVQAAIANPGEIDMMRVDAQQARRILDRLVGFLVSPMLWRYLPYGRFLSAGRVQSVALRLLVEREREIEAFVPVPYWVMGVEARKDDLTFQARLARIDGKKPALADEAAAAAVSADLAGATLRVVSVKDQPKTRHPYPPFTTSTLQQAASSVCGMSPHRTMSLAQKLYESGLITYMRTDSVNVSASARDAAAALIAAKYGESFLPATPNVYRSKAGAQEAHEAIRPTDVQRLPGTLDLDAPAARLYELIWRRFVASQMADAKLSLRTVTMNPVKDALAHAYDFTASTTSVTFKGFLAAMPGANAKRKPEGKDEGDEETDEVKALPDLAVGDTPEVLRWLSDRKETTPPPRFSEAALVKALEENGVGRPSTYAQTIEVLVTRRYATRESRQLVPTPRGAAVNDWLVSRLPALFDVGYTAQMEAELDKVEDGKETSEKMLSAFYAKFREWLDAAKDPPPDPARFQELLALMEEVKTWREPTKRGRRTFDDQEFLGSLRERLATRPETLTERQLRCLAQMAIAYRAQISQADERLAALGWGDVVKSAEAAPPDALVQACFAAIEACGGLGDDKFLASLRRRAQGHAALTDRQFAALARSTRERIAAAGAEGHEALLAQLAERWPDEPEAATDPTLPALAAMLGEIKTWREPAKRGKRTFDDKAFAASLLEQYRRRKSLSPRQVAAIKRMLLAYREQIPDFETRANAIGLSLSAERRAKPRKGAAPRS